MEEFLYSAFSVLAVELLKVKSSPGGRGMYVYNKLHL